MGFWSQNHFTLIPRSLASMNAGRPKSRCAITFPRFSPGLPISRSGAFQTLLPLCAWRIASNILGTVERPVPFNERPLR